MHVTIGSFQLCVHKQNVNSFFLCRKDLSRLILDHSNLHICFVTVYVLICLETVSISSFSISYESEVKEVLNSRHF